MLQANKKCDFLSNLALDHNTNDDTDDNDDVDDQPWLRTRTFL